MSTAQIEWTKVSIWQESKPKKVVKVWSNFGQRMVKKGSSFGDEVSLNFILG
jgi:hypothetical protein